MRKQKFILNEFEFEAVASIDQLLLLAKQNRSCYHTSIKKVIPASVLMNWQACKLLEAMEAGRLLVYPKMGKGVRWGESIVSCHRCKCEVSDKVSNPEYTYYCPECDEDLYSFEVYVKIVEVK